MKRIILIGVTVGAIFLSACDSRNSSGAIASAPAAASPQLSDQESSFVATKKTDAARARGELSIKPYPFKTCAVQIHRPFKNGKPKHRRVYQGYEVLFCCDPCVKAFDMVPDAYMPRIKEAVAAKAERQGSGL